MKYWPYKQISFGLYFGIIILLVVGVQTGMKASCRE
jgi:hypothetical protein